MPSIRPLALALALVLPVALAGCGGRATDQPYETCVHGDLCTQGTGCADTTLPASAGFTGSLCTNSCNVDSDCLQDLTNYAAICVNAQCYIQCPSGSSTCPYGTGCLTFTDQAGNAVDICTP